MRKKQMVINKGLIESFQESFEEIAKDEEVNNGPCLRIFLFLLSKMDEQYRVPLTASQIGKELKMANSNVSIAIKKLVEKKYIEADYIIGRERSYKLSDVHFLPFSATQIEK